MAQTGYTPIVLFNSGTTTNAPTTSNLAVGELAINYTDGKLFYNTGSAIKVIAGVGGLASGSTTQVQYNLSGVFAGSANFTFNGTTVTLANDASISGLTVGKGAGAVSTNTAVGASALAANTSGLANAGLGNSALFNNTSGQQDTAVGHQANYNNTTGNYNVSVGTNALFSNTTGSSNTGLGTQALYLNTTASNNTAVGYQAGYTNTSYSYNTFLGFQAGYYANGGTYNCFVGLGSGYFVTSGGKNTIIGAYNGNQGSLDIRTASNAIVISDGDGKPYIGRIGGDWNQISVSTSMVALTPASGVGMFASINGYNTVSGAQGNWIVYANTTSGANVVAAINGTGLTVNFDYSGTTIRMSTTSGTINVSSFFAY